MKKEKNSILVIAEIANTHEGDFKKARDLIKAAAVAGADAVKFQKFTADELLVPTHPRYEHFRNIEMTDDEWRSLYGFAHEKGLLFFSDVFGLASLHFIKSLPADGIKIHSSDLANTYLLNEVADWYDILLISCGGASELDIFRALKIINPYGRGKKVFLMHGFQNFPTSLNETNLLRIKTLGETFSLPVGFMDHVDAEDPFAHVLPLLAVTSGAVIIEKHLTLDRSLKGIDYYSSLQPVEFGRLVEDIRNIKIVQGTPEIVFGTEENIYRKKMKKHAVAAISIPEGAGISGESLTYKRVESDVFPLFQEEILGKRAIYSISVDEPVTLAKLDVRVGILIIARLNSKRLHNKAILPIMGRPAISYLIERARLCKNVHEVILCTGDKHDNSTLVNVAVKEGIKYFCGDEIDVVSRMLGACEREQLDVLVRATGDDIFFSHEYADLTIEHLLNTNSDYSNNKSLISGSECEVFQVSAIRTIFDFAENRSNTEYLTYYIENDNFQKSSPDIPSHLKRDVSLTLDTREDFEKVSYVLENIYRKDRPFSQEELTAFIDRHPEKFPLREMKGTSSFRDSLNCKLNFKREVNHEDR